MDLLKIDSLPVNKEPDSGVSLDGGFVLPAFEGLAIPGDLSQASSEPIIVGCLRHGTAGKKVPCVRQWIWDHSAQVLPTAFRRSGREHDLVLVLLYGTLDSNLFRHG